MKHRTTAKALCSMGGALALGVALVLASFLLLPGGETSAAPNYAPPFPNPGESLDAAVNWLTSTTQNVDGGFKRFGNANDGYSPSDVGGALYGALAFRAAGYGPSKVYTGTKSIMAWMDDNPDDVAAFAAMGGGESGVVIMALVASCQNPRDWHGYSFVISVTDRFSPDTGVYGGAFLSYSSQANAIMGLAAVSESVPATATQYLLDPQVSGGPGDGCWQVLGICDPDESSRAMMALVAAGTPATHTSLVRATNWLSASQLPAGGWSSWWNPGVVSVDSTSTVIQALAAVGEDFASTSGRWARGGGITTPITVLLEMQNNEGSWSGPTTLWGPSPHQNQATFAGISGVAGRALPLPCREVYVPAIHKN